MTGFLVILVGVATAPVVANQIDTMTCVNSSGGAAICSNANYTNGSVSIISLVTLFYVLAVAVSAMSVAVVGLKQAGLIV